MALSEACQRNSRRDDLATPIKFASIESGNHCRDNQPLDRPWSLLYILVHCVSPRQHSSTSANSNKHKQREISCTCFFFCIDNRTWKQQKDHNITKPAPEVKLNFEHQSSSQNQHHNIKKFGGYSCWLIFSTKHCPRKCDKHLNSSSRLHS